MADLSAPTCELVVAGVRVADTPAALLDGDPTVLSGLTVSWGRDTTVDQPDGSSCSFVLRDPAGGGAFLTSIYTGAPVEVWSSAPTVGGVRDYAVDGSFETTNPAGARATSTRGVQLYDARTDPALRPRVVAAGFRAILVNPIRAGDTIDIPPAPFSTDVTAWDQIPALAIGEVWTLDLAVRPPLGVTSPVMPESDVSWSFVTFGGANDRAPRPLDAGATFRAPTYSGSGWWRGSAWATVTAASVGRWFGARVTVHALATWASFAGTWAGVNRITGYPTPTWAELATVMVDDLHVTAPLDTRRRVLVWAGRITALSASPDLGGGLTIAATAADLSADLGNRVIGDEPWPVQPVATRFGRICDLTGRTITRALDTTPAAVLVSWQDVDATAAWSLLADLATTAGAVLWPATHATVGAYLFLEDPTLRPAAIRLQLVAGVIVIAGIPPADRGSTVLSACDVLTTPITWVTDVTDRITAIDVTWQEQTVNDDGLPAPTDHTVSVVDAAAVLDYGVRRLSVSTQLTTQAAAAGLASRTLAQHDQAPWRIKGITWDTAITPPAPGNVGDLLDLLDGTLRCGRRLLVTDLPAYAPLAGAGPDLAGYLEGGAYTYTGGAWILDLTVSAALGLGASITWGQVPRDWPWSLFRTAGSLTWRDLYGVAAPA